MYEITTFYKFLDLSGSDLQALKANILDQMVVLSIRGTIILAPEGINATVASSPEQMRAFIKSLDAILGIKLEARSTFSKVLPFKAAKVKVRQEIVTFGHNVDFSAASGTHISPEEWNDIIKKDGVVLIDTRNDYEFKIGTFEGAVNPATERFSDLPKFVEKNLDPDRHKNVAMFCTGGVRCEKFAPYLIAKGFENVYQLEGGILNYLASVPKEEQLWQGECFVFDERISVDADLQPGSSTDHSFYKGKSKVSDEKPNGGQ
ncbi:rhodanese-related sulfurtransferase [Leptolyngbya sp. 7M]|uniref:oxygen-dependent tRNA uridine(34) hydroxylase TrhO n=1 Tax=Leptolyngbya sp. 7M TaxID=2812896 RepID=UPI001B8C22FD|nr:rhodanese-like domain-containing protein [Leptolyngbya sp. 7M]QYO66097.1 hypothetical protein JVX88_04665 [Leptolyngbya sp. 7M]